MIVMVDTNIVIDIFTKRSPWFEDSYTALSQTLNDENNECLISASAITDIFYLLHKALGNKEKAKEVLETLSRVITIADVQASDIQSALNSTMTDFEDAVVDAVAERYGASCTLTRNTRDYKNSQVPAITPADYLKKLSENKDH